MAHPKEAKLLASLPPAIRVPLAEALRTAPPTLAAGYVNSGVDYSGSWNAAAQAMRAAEMELDPLPPADTLTAPQRTVATILAYRPEFGKYVRGVPSSAYWRRRWLGLEPAGVLERVVDGADDAKLPLWRYLASQKSVDRKSLEKLGLSLVDRLQARWDVGGDAYKLAFGKSSARWVELSELTGQKELAVWSVARLDEVAAQGRELQPGGDPARAWAQPLFWAAHLAHVPLKPAWDAFFPMPGPGFEKEYETLVKSLPEARRAPVMIGSLGTSPSTRIANGVKMLAVFPSRELTEFILATAKDDKASPLRTELAAIAEKHPVVADALNGASAPPRITLSVARTFAPKGLDDLTPLERKQLVAAGEAYDGERLPAEKRLGANADEETSFAGSLEFRDVVDANGKPAFTVLLYRVDSGSVFRAGTLDEVAGIAQDSLECSDASLREALHDVIWPPKPRTAKAAPKKKTAPKKKIVKKKAVKKKAR